MPPIRQAQAYVEGSICGVKDAVLNNWFNVEQMAVPNIGTKINLARARWNQKARK